MAELRVTIKPDASGLANAFLRGNYHETLKREVNRIAMSVSRYAKQLTPVKTGHLRSSIQVSPAGLMLSALVSTNVEYAFYVHDGTKYMRARPFLKYGAMFAQVGVDHEIAKRLDESFTQAFKYAGFSRKGK